MEDYAQSEEVSCQSLCSEVNTHLASIFSEMKISGRAAAAIHGEFLRRNTQHFSLFKLTRDCLYCLQRNPEHVLECGHTLCDTCVSIFGEPVQGKEYRWKLNACLLCLSRSHFQARLLPPTCGSRLISIDGGGSRGIIPLAYLNELEDVMGLSYPIQENFDFGIGTSSGLYPLKAVTFTDTFQVASQFSPCLQSTGAHRDVWSSSITSRNASFHPALSLCLRSCAGSSRLT
jgi:hypothetical protein